MGIGAILVTFGGWLTAGALGMAGTLISGTFGAVLAGAIGGAVVGAVVGGLAAAIMGGDIMDGVLYGAIGGAVGGALGGLFVEGAVFGGPMTGVVEAGTTVVGPGGTATSAGAELAFGAGDAVTTASGMTEGSAMLGGAATEGGVTAFSTLGEATEIAGVTIAKDFIVAGVQGGADADRLKAEQEQAELNRLADEVALDKTLALERELGLAKAEVAKASIPEDLTVQVAEIDARSAMDITKQKSADLASQLAANKAEITAGNLREDEAWQSMRNTATGVLISRATSKPLETEIPDDKPIDFIDTPDTPDYVTA